MKSVRLTESLKSEIVNSIYENSKCAAKIEKLKEKQEALFVAVRDYSLGKNKETYLSLPRKLQESRGSISISGNPEESWFCLQTDGEDIPCPVDTVLWSELSASLQKRISTYIKNTNSLNIEANQIKVKARQVIYSCNSTKQLLEVMPEAKKYIPENLLASGTQLMVSEEAVNELRKLAA